MIHKIIFAAAFCLLYVSFSFAQTDEINIVPKPQVATATPNLAKFTITRKTKILADTDVGRQTADDLNAILKREYGFTLGFTTKRKNNTIIIDLTKRGSGESYSIHVVPDELMINGEERGLFYAIQSLRQVISSGSDGSISIPSLEIRDLPRFGYRGMHLDVSRHFMPVEFVKKYIDLLAQYKFNYFHWHLTDDQGWRIEIKEYPKLTEIGSKRSETHVGNYSPVFNGDGIPVEGFYTQQQIRDVVKYARDRYVTVVPEIELPGHASAALAAYPQFGCKADHKYEVKKTWGIFKEVFCPTDETFKFLEDVIDETIKLFPDSPYIHIGGDEVLKDHWKESAFVQELKKRENLKDEHEVQSYFVQRIEKFVNSKGKKIIGWDEILEGGLAPNATVMSWRGTKGGIEAAKSKHDVIMTPTDFCYLDYAQGDPATEPLNIGGWLPLEKVYQFDPVPKGLTADEAKYIIGGQGNIWTEYLKQPENVEYMGFPRMLAIAESVWSRPEDKNYADFTRRLTAQFARLDRQNVSYRIPPPAGLVNKVLADAEKADLDLSSSLPGARVFYTIDGSTPDEKSMPYTKPLQVDLTEKGRVDVKCVVILANGRKSSVYTATLLRSLWRGPSPDPVEKRPGVAYSLYVPSNEYGQDTPPITGESRSIGLAQFSKQVDQKGSYVVTFDGYLNVPIDAIYEFQSDYTWDTTILIAGQKLIDEAGDANRAVRSAVIPLRSGWHKVSLRYNHRVGEAFWRVRWAIKGQNWRNIGGGELVH